MYMLAENKQTLVIDTRARSLYQEGHIVGSVCFDLEQAAADSVPLVSLKSLSQVVQGDDTAAEALDSLENQAYKEVVLVPSTAVVSDIEHRVVGILKESDSYLSVRVLQGVFEAFAQSYSFMLRDQEHASQVCRVSIHVQPAMYIYNHLSLSLSLSLSLFLPPSLLLSPGFMTDELLSQGARVLVHCKRGLSGGGPAAVAVMYCMEKYEMSLQDAYYYVRQMVRM
eukprot:TRINITY_DN1463_c0_g1_i3.p1 TRINITY_DN1463_c0_g1~~TRINITY_DN1463_c0_g1_i3.p1  ORF type:complete len:225 (-),score=45.22 TRINITY_DN1463_c0_g1_i3:56-730(-)